MKIGIGNDHVAYSMKIELKEYLKGLGYEVIDYGTDNDQRTDYPIYGKKVAEAIINREIDKGILICGTGFGISVSANKLPGIRAVLCSEPYTARLGVQHNNANIVAMGARVIGSEMAKMIVDEFLKAEFEGGRHQKRLNLIQSIEENFRNI